MSKNSPIIKEFGSFSGQTIGWISSKLNMCDPGWVVTDIKILNKIFFEPEDENFYDGIIEYTKDE